MKKQEEQKSLRSKEHPPTEKSPKDGDGLSEVLAVLDVEGLLRLRKRLEMHGRKKMVQILTFEIKAREAKEREEEQSRTAALEHQRKNDTKGAS